MSTEHKRYPFEEPYGYVHDVLLRSWSDADRSYSLAISARLADLRPKLNELRLSYEKDRVSLDYSNGIAEAYLLAYVPHYMWQALNALHFSRPIIDADLLRVAVLCSGPGPELVALREYLGQTGWQGRLEVHLVDIQMTGWTPVLSALHRAEPNLFLHDVDIADSIGTLPGDLCDLDILMLQNCANELPRGFGSRLNEYLELLSPSGTLILSDQRNYDMWSELAAGFTNRMREGWTHRRIDRFVEHVEPPTQDSALWNFFNTEPDPAMQLMPRVNNRFSVIWARRMETD